MKIDEYREWLHEDIARVANANISTPEEEFLRYVTNVLSDGEEFDDFVECYYEGISRRKANIRIDGYALDETDGSCCVFISDYRGPHKDDAIRSEDINLLFNKIRHFVEEATKYEMYLELEESTQVYEFAETLYLEKDNITKYRFYLLTDAFNRQRKKNIKDTEVNGTTVELNVWDVTRIFDVVNSKTQKESVEIMLSDFESEGIPCVKAVECVDVIADIEVTPKYYDVEKEDENAKPENIITYSSYLAVVPGKILNDLYLEYGSRLLEGNVRSFLSVRGKVNKSIQNTIKNYPEMFFAYNNGIAATASELETELTSEGLKITRIKDLQIVNGGQTTASIANTLLTARKDEVVDISKLYVPMKISVLDPSMSERIIPKISEYSNSQNKVDASDFFSNHPFHIRMEDYSRKTPAPAVHGNQYQQYWYYERTRGQYNQGKMKFKPKSSQMKQYEIRYPESQVIKMVELAKYMEIYEGAPDVVSKGKQAVVKIFADNIKKQWEKLNTTYNAYYFKRVVALAIIFKGTDEIIKHTSWYMEKHSYKANVAAYTMSVLFDYIRSNAEGLEMDFMRIWNQQELYPELEQQLRILCTQVYEFITQKNRLTENVTQWCKQSNCWKLAQKHKWNILPEFIETLIDVEQIKSEEKTAKKERKMDSEFDALNFIVNAGKNPRYWEYWELVYNWGKSRKLLSDIEIEVLNRVINRKIPNDRDAKIVIRARERLINEGMPMQF